VVVYTYQMTTNKLAKYGEREKKKERRIVEENK
jgi:hypothetical protein